MAAYDLTIQDTEFINSSDYPSATAIDDSHFAIAYETGSNGFIATYSVDEDGIITLIDTLQHQTGGEARDNSLGIMDGTLVLAYSADTGSTGTVKTFSYDGSFDNITEEDSHDFETTYAQDNSLAVINDTSFAVAFYGTGTFDMVLVTFSVDGSLTITEEALTKHDSSFGSDNSLKLIDTNVLVLAYKGAGNDGFTKTFTVNGSLAITQEDSLEFDTANGEFPSVAIINTTHYAIMYMGVSDDGFISTFSINGTYDITELDTLEHDTVLGEKNALTYLDDTHSLGVHNGNGNNGYLTTFAYDGSYNITETNQLQFDGNEPYEMQMSQLLTGTSLLVYRNASSQVTIKTVKSEGVEPIIGGNSNFLMFM